MRIYDITRRVANGIANWPGDTPYAFRLAWKRSEGASVNVGSVTMSVHTGTHADAPFHFADDAHDIAAVPPSVYLGPAAVVDMTGRGRIRRRDLEVFDFADTPRVLLRTDAWTDSAVFPTEIPLIEPDVPDFLMTAGVFLLGVDVPSVDALDSHDLPVHNACFRGGIHILESLDLSAVPEGRYELLALPLRLEGADASPIRAVLRTL